ncbi:MAG: hypothetical protein PSX81_11820 [bacterium]|nr:hypothetical protein [bacterium]
MKVGSDGIEKIEHHTDKEGYIHTTIDYFGGLSETFSNEPIEPTNLFIDNKKAIVRYASDHKFTIAERIKELERYRNGIDISILKYSGNYNRLLMKLELMKAKNEDKIIADVTDHLYPQLKPYYTDREREDYIHRTLIRENHQYQFLNDDVTLSKNNLGFAIDSKSFIDEILGELKTDLETNLPETNKKNKKEKQTSFNQFQTVWLLNELRQEKFFDSNTSNVLLSQTITMLTGMSNLQSVGFFSKLEDETQFDENKKGLIALLEKMLGKLK